MTRAFFARSAVNRMDHLATHPRDATATCHVCERPVGSVGVRVTARDVTRVFHRSCVARACGVPGEPNALNPFSLARFWSGSNSDSDVVDHISDALRRSHPAARVLVEPPVSIEQRFANVEASISRIRAGLASLDVLLTSSIAQLEVLSLGGRVHPEPVAPPSPRADRNDRTTDPQPSAS